MSSIHVTIFFIGLFVLIQIPLTIMVGFRRVQTNIQFFDGGDQTLLRRMRAHGNYTETVPIVLLAMAAAEVALIPHWALWTGGTTLLVGRLMHAVTLATIGWGPTRAIGMVLTFIPMAAFGGWCVFQALQ
jgi:uncharacterized protein